MPAIGVISGASGVGKSCYNHMLITELGFEFSVSATTRDLRPREIDGIHYKSIPEPRFIRHVLDGDFAEWAGVHHGNLYGTFRAPIEDAVARGGRILLEIDVEGRKRLMRNLSPELHEHVFSVFIKSPSLAELERRLRSRGDITDEKKIRERLAKAEFEESHAGEYDITIVNDDLDRRKKELRKVIDERFGCWIDPVRAP